MTPYLLGFMYGLGIMMSLLFIVKWESWERYNKGLSETSVSYISLCALFWPLTWLLIGWTAFVRHLDKNV